MNIGRSIFLAVCLAGSLAQADSFTDYSSLLHKLTLSEPRASIANIASGFGASAGQAYASVSYSDYDLQTEVEGDDDGSIMFGMGFGDPAVTIGGEVTVAITSVSTGLWGDGKFADEGNVSVKIHKHVSPLLKEGQASIALGASNVTGWGATTDNPVNSYLAYTAQDRFGEFQEYAFAYTLGYGTAVAGLEDKGDWFLGAAIGYNDYSMSIANIGSETHISASYFPQIFPGTSVTLSRADVFNENNSERFILTLGYAFNR
jgi:hypothetical protein